MLLSVNKLTKCGGGSLTTKRLKDCYSYDWKIDENFIIKLELPKRTSMVVPYVTKINTMDILTDTKGCFPVLCFNKLINKWFCIDSSAANAIVDDENELKSLKDKSDDFNEASGFFSNAIDAIAHWNILAAMDLMTNANSLAYLD